MQDRFFTNQDTLLTNQELAALQLSKDVNQYNTIIEDIKKLRGGVSA